MDGPKPVLHKSSKPHQGFWKAQSDISTDKEAVFPLGLNFEDLSKLYRETGAGDAFQTALKDRGVNSKLLREKLGKALSPFR